MMENKINQRRNVLSYRCFHVSEFTSSTFIEHIMNCLLSKIKSLQRSFIITIFDRVVAPYLLSGTAIWLLK